VRLTRRGRIVVLAVLVVLAAGVAGLLALPSQAAAPAGTPRVVVVQPGDSLWTIIERYRPGADPVRAVEELRRANGLSGSTLQPGVELTLPARW
jgi:LysM repeat protein